MSVATDIRPQQLQAYSSFLPVTPSSPPGLSTTGTQYMAGLQAGMVIGLPPVLNFAGEEMRNRILPDILACVFCAVWRLRHAATAFLYVLKADDYAPAVARSLSRSPSRNLTLDRTFKASTPPLRS